MKSFVRPLGVSIRATPMQLAVAYTRKQDWESKRMTGKEVGEVADRFSGSNGPTGRYN